MNKVIYSNKEDFDKKIGLFKSAGLEKMHIISDFDRTLTRAFVDEERVANTWEVFDLTDEYTRKRNELVSIYQPIEFDPLIPLETKRLKMDEWWKLHLEALIKYGLTKQLIEEGVSHKKLVPRDGLDDLAAFTKEYNIPFLVFSAGLGDVIQELFKERGISYSNIHVVSNFFVFDDLGIPVGFKSDIVHTYNKSEIHVRGTSYSGEVLDRKNVILLGDSLGDISMADGMEYENIIRIGFLNGNINTLDAYKEVYDVVIVEDGDLAFVNDLLVTLSE